MVTLIKVSCQYLKPVTFCVNLIIVNSYKICCLHARNFFLDTTKYIFRKDKELGSIGMPLSLYKLNLTNDDFIIPRSVFLVK